MESGSRKNYSSKVCLWAMIVSLALAVIIFISFMPKPFSEEEIQQFDSLAQQISTEGLYPASGAYSSLKDVINSSAIKVEISQYLFDSYKLSFSTNRGDLEYRIDEFKVTGPILNNLGFYMIDFILCLLIFFILYPSCRYIFDYLEENDILHKLPDEPDPSTFIVGEDDILEFGEGYCDDEQDDAENTDESPDNTDETPDNVDESPDNTNVDEEKDDCDEKKED